MSSLNYYSNFDDLEFKKKSKNEFNKLIDDDCDISQRNYDNNKKLKYFTTSFKDLEDVQLKNNIFGIGLKDELFIPSDKIDMYSSLLNGVDGNKLTNCNVKNILTQLPIPTTPFRGQLQHGDIDIEDNNVRSSSQVKKNSCLPRIINFYERSFYIFDKEIPVPNALDSIETPDDGFYTGRNGISSRFDNRFSHR